jgi:hypothetical protein
MSDNSSSSLMQTSANSESIAKERLTRLLKRHLHAHFLYLPIACAVGAVGQSIFPNSLGFVICSLALIAGIVMALAKYPTCLAQAELDWTWRNSALAIAVFIVIGSFTMLITIFVTALLPRGLDWTVIGRQAIATYGVLFVGLGAYLFRAGDDSKALKARVAAGERLLEE